MISIEYKTILDIVVCICLWYLWDKRARYNTSSRSNGDESANDRLEILIMAVALFSNFLLFSYLIWQFGVYLSWWK